MRVHYETVIDIETGVILFDDCEEYSGPVELCDRGQSKQVANQGMQQSTQNQGNAQKQLADTAAGVSQFNKNLQSFLRYGRRTYGPNGEFMRNTNAQATEVAAGGSNALQGDLALNATRTGANTAGYAATEAEARRQGQRDLTGSLITADSERLKNLTAIEQQGLDESKFPAQVSASLYGPSVGGASSELGVAGDAAKTPSTWDAVTGDIIGAGADVAKGFAG